MVASLESLLTNLNNLLLYPTELTSGAENELKWLCDELNVLKAFLKNASRKHDKDDKFFEEWARPIREVVDDAEDAIDNCINDIASKKGKNITEEISDSLAELVKSLIEVKVKPLSDKAKVDSASLTDITGGSETRAAERKVVRQKKRLHVVGFEEEVEQLFCELVSPSEHLVICSITGMPAIGKTTIALKVFEDPRIRLEFATVIWVYASSDLNIKAVLHTILGKFTHHQPNVTMEKLTQIVKNYLEAGKFFLVIDDVATFEHWREIEAFLPMDNKQGRVLITTRDTEVGKYVNGRRQYNLRSLTDKESWKLLQYEVYGNLNVVDKELEPAGMTILEYCRDHDCSTAFAIILIAAILADKISTSGDSISAIRKEWEAVARSMESLVAPDQHTGLDYVISLSYSYLPYELRDSFLYLGMFPKDTKIPAEKLIQLWIAEGFIQEIPGKRLEQIARDNLQVLINRNLVLVEEAKLGGEAKICRVYDLVHEFCKREAKFNVDSLYHEINMSIQGDDVSPFENLEKVRRLCIHDHINDFLKGKPKVPKARSFLCSPKASINLKPGDVSTVTNAFRVLRVFDVERIKFPTFPLKFVQFSHLRYLTLTLANHQWKVLPEAITNLWNLQTLILHLRWPTLEIKADIWKMRQLRHLRTNVSIILKGDGKGEWGDNLQTVSRLSTQSCTDDFFNKARNLITLGIHGELSILVKSGCLKKLGCLNRLKLVHDGQPLQCLPKHDRFPPKLTVLVLIRTLLDWEHMSTLGMIDTLKVLKLKDNAFTGTSWNVTGGGFTNLEVLHIERADITNWSVSGDPFPKLRYLSVINCEKLLGVPAGLSENLEMLHLEYVTLSAVSSAEEIKKSKLNQGAKGKAFKLEIAAADLIRNI